VQGKAFTEYHFTLKKQAYNFNRNSRYLGLMIVYFPVCVSVPPSTSEPIGSVPPSASEPIGGFYEIQ
jgi:hypothetical protein